jgi:hemolysin activation/secretion protein/predicted porin
MALPAAAWSQVPQLPDAGRLLETLRDRPAMPSTPPTLERIEEERPAPAAGDVAVRVDRFEFSGHTRIPTDDLAAELAGYTGRELRFSELSEAAARITRLYRARGYLVARAVLPPQDVQGGVVRIEVREGRLGEVKVQRGRNLRLAPERIDGFLSSLRPGEVIREQDIEAALLLLSDTPGVVVRSVLRPGAAPGTADLVVQVHENASAQAQIGYDNHGSRYTGRNRLMVDLSLHDMMGQGEALGLRSLTTFEGLTANTLLGSLPIGSSGLRVGGTYTLLTYDVGRDLTPLRANGKAESTGLFAAYPLLRSRDANLQLQLGWERRLFKDYLLSGTSETAKRSERVTLSATGDLRDRLGGGDGFTNYSVGYTEGHLDRLTVGDAMIDAISAQIAGRFEKLEWSLSRLQALPGGWSVRLSLAGQRASRNLDSSEEFYLGGAQGVRAYGQGEGAGDEGLLARLELRKYLGRVGGFQAEGLLFHDTGRVRIDNRPWDPAQADNVLSLRGTGVGLALTRPNVAVSLSVANPVGSTPAGVQRPSGPMVWLQVTASPQFLNTRRLVTPESGESMSGSPFDFYGSIGLQVERVSRGSATPAGPRGATQSASPTGVSIPMYTRWSDPTSTLGVRGSLPLGGGLNAWWQGEIGLGYDWSDRAGKDWVPEGHASTSIRDTAIGLRDSKWGSVLYGHWAMPLRNVTSAFDPFDDDSPAAASTLMGSPGFGVGGSNTVGPLSIANDANNDDAAFVRRQRGVLQYWTPTWKGLSARIAWSDNHRSAAPDVGRGSIWGASVSWKRDAWLVMLGYEEHTDYFGIASLGRNNRGVGSSTAVTAGTSSSDHGARIGVAYDFGRTRVAAMVDRLSYSEDGVIPGNTVPDLRAYRRNAQWLGVTHQIGRLELRAAAGRALPGSCETISNDPALRECSTEGLGASMWAVGFAYKISEPLTVFGSYAKVQNKASSAYNFRVGGVFATPGNSAGVGADPAAIGLGIKYRF